MAYSDLENSIESGRPVYFYEFVYGSITWRYTSAEEVLTANGHEWKPAAITDDGVRQTGEISSDAMTITAPSWVGPSQLFMSGTPSRGVQVSVYQYHDGDPSNDVVAVYVGEVSQVNYPFPGSCRITAETLMASLEREGLRLAWQRACPYVLYDPVTCKLDRTPWGRSFTVLSFDGQVAQVEFSVSVPDNYLRDGYLEWNHPFRGVELLPIESQVGSLITLFTPSAELMPGATGTAYPGCNLSPAACQAFGNYDNYGGHPDIPGKSPFDGNPVF
jgi:uncharacterized phage protein (TIGR02218 family)